MLRHHVDRSAVCPGLAKMFKLHLDVREGEEITGHTFGGYAFRTPLHIKGIDAM
jgi:hypothetical protein